MSGTEKLKRRIATLFDVNTARLGRWLRRSDTSDLLSLYEQASNAHFHNERLETRTFGAMLLCAVADEVEHRFPEAEKLHLREAPYPLRSWFLGIPQEEYSRGQSRQGCEA